MARIRSSVDSLRPRSAGVLIRRLNALILPEANVSLRVLGRWPFSIAPTKLMVHRKAKSSRSKVFFIQVLFDTLRSAINRNGQTRVVAIKDGSTAAL